MPKIEAEEVIGENKEVVEPKNKRKYVFKIIIFLIIAGLAAVAVHYFKQYQKIKNNPEIISQEETAVVVSEIGKLMELPGDESPSLATVKDKEKIKDQSFFQKAENGDKLLIYTNAKKAILYRPSTKKIIEVAPLLIQNGEPATNSIESVTQSQDQAEQTSQGNLEEKESGLVENTPKEDDKE